MENLFRTGKTKLLTGTAIGESREEAMRPPATGAGGSHLAARVGCSRSWEGVEGKGKLCSSINTHFPHTTNKIKQHPAGYFQATTSFLP